MRGLVAGLLIAAVILGIALIAAAGGALGVAAIGWLLHRWFGLSQWQGTLVALVVAVALGSLVYKLVTMPPAPPTWEDEMDEFWDEEEEEEAPPIVPWRRQRPTPGELPPEKPTGGGTKTPGKRK